MPQITKSVNKTQVHGDETFIYTFNVSYSGLTEPTVQGKLTDFFPTKIIPTLPQASGNIKNITQAPVAGGTLVTFDFGEIPTGTSISFQVACKFGPGRVNNDSFTNSADLYADNVVVNTGVAQTVTLTLTEDFRLNKSVQSSSLVRPGDIVTFNLYILNYGDSGAEISDVVITDTLPNGLTPDLSFTPIGNDAPELGYNDPTYNGRTGSWNNKTLTFTLPNFKGNRYSITFKAIVDIDVVPSQEIINTANWTVNEVERDRVSAKIRVFDQNDISANQVAYNSFGVKANQVKSDGSTKPLLPTEPNKVVVKTLDHTKSSIGDFVWEDLNGNGIYDEGEPGVNGITVELYDSSMKLIRSTVTSNNYNGKPGYYLFTNLNAGKYYVKFRPYGDYKLTIQQASSLDGSKPNKTTGLTDIIYLGSNESKLDIDAGVFTILCPPPTINASNKCIHVGDPFNPLDGVSATDCRDNQLTVTVVSNNVNNQVPGTYTVIYRATDRYGRKTTKTIYVKVCPNGPYELSISNLIQSVALEQAGIRNILNAESLKLRKIVANGTAEQMLCAQESVNDMIKTLTNLELVLLNKLDIFSCQLCDDCCSEGRDCPSCR